MFRKVELFEVEHFGVGVAFDLLVVEDEAGFGFAVRRRKDSGRFNLFYETILRELCFMRVAVLVCEQSYALFHILFPLSLVLGPICIIKHSKPIS